MRGMVLLDTDVIIDYLNGAEPLASAVGELLVGRVAAVSAVSAFELLAGVRGKRRLEAVDILLRSVRVLALDEAAARQAGAIYTRLKAAGALVGNSDILVAATALSNRLPVLTRNTRHFQRVEGLELLSF